MLLAKGVVAVGADAAYDVSGRHYDALLHGKRDLRQSSKISEQLSLISFRMQQDSTKLQVF